MRTAFDYIELFIGDWVQFIFNLWNYKKIKNIKKGDIYFRDYQSAYIIEKVQWRGWLKYSWAYVRFYGTNQKPFPTSLHDNLNIHTMSEPKFKQNQWVMCDDERFRVDSVQPKLRITSAKKEEPVWEYGLYGARTWRKFPEHTLTTVPNYNQYWAALNE